MYGYQMHAWRTEEGIRSPGAGVMDLLSYMTETAWEGSIVLAAACGHRGQKAWQQGHEVDEVCTQEVEG